MRRVSRRRSGGGGAIGLCAVGGLVLGLAGVVLAIVALCQSGGSQMGARRGTQTLNYANETINGVPALINIDRLDWKQGIRVFEKKCAVYDLPAHADEGAVIEVYNHHRACSYLRHPDRFGLNTPAHVPQATGNAEFWHIQVCEKHSYVKLKWVTYNHGWTVMDMRHAHVQHIRPASPDYIYTVATVKGIPENPDNARDFVATVGINPDFPKEFGRIVNIALIPEDPQNEIEAPEMHHTHLHEVDEKLIFAAPSLENNNSMIAFFDCSSQRACTATSYISHDRALALGASSFHTTHYDHDSHQFLISHLGGGNLEGNGPSGFVTVSPNVGPEAGTDELKFERYATVNATGPNSLGEPDSDAYHYDFTIDMCNNLIAFTSWGFPKAFHPGFAFDAAYGRSIRIAEMPNNFGSTAPVTTENLKTIATFTVDPPASIGGVEGGESVVPLEIRQLHQPNSKFFYVGLTLPGGLTSIYFDENTQQWVKKTVISPEQLVADGLSELVTNQDGNDPKLGDASVPLVTDITVSEDDSRLYVSLWLMGKVLAYDIRDPHNPVLVSGHAGIGGVTTINPGVNVFNPHAYEYASGKTITGGSQMLRLTPGGDRLIITTSLYRAWDEQFYPWGPGSIAEHGGSQIMLRTGVSKGEQKLPMSIDTTFGVNGVLQYANLTHPEVDGPFCAGGHEGQIKGVVHT